MATKTSTRKKTATKKTTAGRATRGTRTTRTNTKSKASSARSTRSATTTRARSTSRATRATNAASQSRMTTNHAVIRQWVEERGGYPATVAGTETMDDAGVLRIDYPGYSGQDTLERISWDEFFDKFEEAGLAFLYQDETKEGGPSRFSKLVSRDETTNARV